MFRFTSLFLLCFFACNLIGSDLFKGSGQIKSLVSDDDLDEAASFANPGKVPVKKGVVRNNPKGHHQEWTVTPTKSGENTEFTLSFKKPVPVGSVLFIGDFKSSYLTQDANGQWVKLRYPGEKKRAVRLVPFSKITEATKIKLEAPAEFDRQGKLKKSLALLAPLSGRFINIAPRADLKVSSCIQPGDGFRPDPRQANPETLLDGTFKHRNWSSSKHKTPINDKDPEWIMLDWRKPRTMRGVIFLIGSGESGAGTILVQKFVGKGDPDETNNSQWKTISTIKPYRTWRPPLCWEALADFGKDITTRALRFVMPAGLPSSQVQGGKEGINQHAVSFGEILVLQDLHDRPVPKKISRRKQLPDGVVPITFTMPKAGKASIRIRNAKGEIVKNLVNGQSFDAGENTVYWDLSNLEDYWYPFTPSKWEYKPPPETQKIAMPGNYTWEGVWHPDFELDYQYSYYPLKKHGMAWITSDTTGGWLADHTPPKTVVRAKDKMWVGTFCEAGNALLEADLDMKKLYGANRIWLACPKILAYDNGKIYYLEQGGWAKKIILIEIDTKTKQSRRVFAKDLDKKVKIDLQGLVIRDDQAYISDKYNNKLWVADISANLAAKRQGFGWDRVYKVADHEKMKITVEAPINKPGRLRPYDPEHLIAVSGKKVVLINTVDFKITPLITGLINPQGLAWDPQRKEIYVGEMEPLHQVKVFNTKGKLLRTIGKKGPHQLSTEAKLFDKDNLESPKGLDIDAKGNLWVCEANEELKRTSVWNREGKCINDVIGPTVYGGGGDIDPKNANRMFYSGKEFHRDPATGKIKLARLNWRGSQGLKFSGPRAHNFNGLSPSYPFYNDGKLFFTMFQGWAMGGINCIYAYEDGQVKPVSAIGSTPAVIYDALGIEHVPDRAFGHAVLFRNDPKIDFDWKQEPAGPKVAKDRFAVRWTGNIIVPKTGSYKFYVDSDNDDRVRVSVGDEKILNKWDWDKKRWITERKVNLKAGKHPITIDYLDIRGLARVRLEWSGPGIEKQVIPSSAFTKPGLKGVYFNPGRKENIFAWTDLNADGKIQKNEIKTKTLKSDQGLCDGAGGTWQFKVNKNFQAALCTYGGGKRQLLFFEPSSKTDKGYPIYKLPSKLLPFPGKEVSALMVDEKGNAIILSNYVYSISPTGKVNWRYINRWPSLHSGHRTSATGEEPGVMIATTRFFGAAPINKEIGEAISISSNLGSTYLISDDGFYLDRVFKDVRTGLSWRCNEPPSKALMNKLSLGDEHFGGTFQRIQDAKGTRYQYVVGQPHSSVVEITGLDKIQRLPGGKLKVTSKDLANAEKLRQLRALKKAANKKYVVKKLKDIKIDGKDNEWTKERIDGFALGYDDQNLYILFSGRDWRSPFKNATKDNFTEAFKKGDVVDIMLQTQPKANPKRGNGEYGDIRLSLTQVNGKPAAILYDFVVPGTSKDKRRSFSSPWRTIYIDQVKLLPNAKIAVTRKKENYTMEAAIPLKDIHFSPKKAKKVKGDVGRVLSDQTGSRAVDRVYWSNKNTKIMADVPSEARIQPNLWGTFIFE